MPGVASILFREYTITDVRCLALINQESLGTIKAQIGSLNCMHFAICVSPIRIKLSKDEKALSQN